jgi:hypothetical protein
MELPRSSAPRSNGWFMDVALDVCRGHTIVQRDALIQQSLTTGSQTCPARADAQVPLNNLPPFAEDGNISARAASE